MIRLQSYDGSVKKAWKGANNGASIYTVAYDRWNNLLYSGAHDGSLSCWRNFASPNNPTLVKYDAVKLHPFTQHLIETNEQGRSVANKDKPGNVGVWGINYIIVIMNSGRILAICGHTPQVQRELWFDERLKRYGVLAVSPQNHFIAVGGLQGEFWLLKTTLEGKKIVNFYSLTRSKL